MFKTTGDGLYAAFRLPADAINAAVAAQQALLDNCEHLIDAAAHLAETVLAAAPKVRVLATSARMKRVGSRWRIDLALRAETSS